MLAALVLIAVVGAPDAQAAYERGRRLYELGSDMPEARAALDEAIRLRPDFADAYLYRAMVSADVNGLAAARSDFQTAVSIAPGMKEAHRFYAEALASGGEVDAAEAEYRKALELDANYGEATYMLARLYRKKGDLERAIPLFERDAALEPKGSAHHELGEIFLEKGDDASARRELEQDLEIDATCYESRINLAGLLLDGTDWEGARRQYQESLAYHPADERALSGLGRAYLALGDYEMAVATLRSALDLAPGDSRLGDALASARRSLKWSYLRPFAAAALAIGLLAGGVILWRRHERLRRS